MTDFHALCAELVDALDQCQRLCGDQPESFLVWKARAALVQPEPQGLKLIYRYNPATIAECGGPCEQGPQYCDCGQIKGEPEPQEVTDEELLGIEDLEAAWNAQADAFNSWDELGIDEIVCWAQQQALARWGRPAKPEPQVPTDEEICDLWSWAAGQDQGSWPTQQHCFARAVLARWGRPAIKPVPVAERLPGPKDCDGEGRCWLLYRSASMNKTPTWSLVHRRSIFDADYTNWLPHWALPVPRSEPSNP